MESLIQTMGTNDVTCSESTMTATVPPLRHSHAIFDVVVTIYAMGYNTMGLGCNYMLSFGNHINVPEFKIVYG